MRALVFHDAPHLEKRHPDPEPASGEVLIEVHLAGVCSTDLEIMKGYMGFRGVMGHEFVGTVREGPKAWLNRRVVAEINCVCGGCVMCGRGEPHHCLDRTVVGIVGRDGAFAEYVAVPAANLHAVPENVSNEAAVFVEPLAAAYRILEQVSIGTAHEAVVLGDGRLGQLVARVVAGTGAQTTLVGRDRAKLDIAEATGLACCLASDYEPNGRADYVVDATGSPEGFRLAMAVVRPRGTIILKSTTAAGAEALNLAPIVVNEITVVGSRCGPFPPALDALSEGRVDPRPLVSRCYPLDGWKEALEAAKAPETLKVLLDMKA